jgi:hypothetical protein
MKNILWNAAIFTLFLVWGFGAVEGIQKSQHCLETQGVHFDPFKGRCN